MTQTYLNKDGTKFWTAEGTDEIRLYDEIGESFTLCGLKSEGCKIEECAIDYAQP